jgi:hypothetical protein
VRKPGAATTRVGLGVSVLLALASILALLSKLLPVFPQHNLPWILLALPAWIGLASGLWLMRPRKPRPVCA